MFKENRLGIEIIWGYTIYILWQERVYEVIDKESKKKLLETDRKILKNT